MKKIIALNFLIVLFSLYSCSDDPEPDSSTPSISTGSATNLSTTSATVNVSLTKKTSSTARIGIMYGTSYSSLYNNEDCLYFFQGNNAISLTNLNSGTTYYYMAYATDERGNYVYGSVRTFQTTSASASVTTLSASSIGSTYFSASATLSGASAVTEWGFVVSTSYLTNPSTGSFYSFNTTADGTYTMNFTRASSNTTYYYCAYAKLTTGKYIYGSVRSVKTSTY